MFKIGDKVEIIAGRFSNIPNKIGVVSNILPPNLCVDIDLNTQYLCHESEIKLVPKVNFRPGDRIKINSNSFTIYVGQEGNFSAYHLTLFNFAIVRLDGDSFDTIFKLDSLDLIPPTAVNTTPTSTVGWTIPIIPIDFSGSISFANAFKGVDHSVHTCNWKFYYGITERYEFCTICNKKRNTDRWN